jgi:RluA family pseudouridine synthase
LIEMTVGPLESGKKVHRLMRQLLPGVPLSGVHKMIRTGRIKRNGKKAKADEVVVEGDVLRLYIADEDFAKVSKAKKKFGGVPRDIDIVYEDDHMIVVNKPAGLLTHGTNEEQKDTLTNRVLAYLADHSALDYRVFTPAPANRLDRNTSGIILFGKTGETTRSLAQALHIHEIRKWYLAIVVGKVTDAGVIEAKLIRDQISNVTRVDSTGQTAITRYESKAVGTGSSVLKVELVTGRTHQIRAHLAHIHHPLWDDIKYGAKKTERSEPQHQWLHAGWVQLEEGRVLHAPLPPAFQDKLKELGYSQRQIEAIQTF